jgi:hypothetical protein
MVDGQDRPGKVTVGASEGHPGYGGFELCAGGEAAPVEVAAAQGPEMDPDGFQTALSPYGQWVNMPGYGMVWQPYPAVVGPDFQPYGTEGHWVYTNAGWLWASGYSWGWAPFHYGTWFYGSGGWAWIPGRVWAPAWVTWRSGGGYVGWAPMGPAGVTVVRQPTYVYVQNNNFTAVNVHEHYVVGVQAQTTIYERTQPLPSAQVVNGHPVAPVNAGPQPTVISEATGHPVSAVPVHTVSASVPPATQPGVHYAAGATAQHPVAVAPLPAAQAKQYVAATRASGAPMPSTNTQATPTQGARSATPANPGMAAGHAVSPAAVEPVGHGVTSPNAVTTHPVAPTTSQPTHAVPGSGPSAAEHVEPAAVNPGHGGVPPGHGGTPPGHEVNSVPKKNKPPPPKEGHK